MKGSAGNLYLMQLIASLGKDAADMPELCHD